MRRCMLKTGALVSLVFGVFAFGRVEAQGNIREGYTGCLVSSIEGGSDFSLFDKCNIGNFDLEYGLDDSDAVKYKVEGLRDFYSNYRRKNTEEDGRYGLLEFAFDVGGVALVESAIYSNRENIKNADVDANLFRAGPYLNLISNVLKHYDVIKSDGLYVSENKYGSFIGWRWEF